jgi:hypothetical protein
MSKAKEMAEIYATGVTQAEIGRMYGVTRQAVQQLMKAHCGTTSKDGGPRALSRLAKADKKARIERDRGCTLEQYAELRKFGQESGVARWKTPIGAFALQRANARHRGIDWDLKLWDWWVIWRDSGKWNERGRGNGYVMSRKGDVGPYAIGNVFIQRGGSNTKEAMDRAWANVRACKNGQDLHR